MSKEKQIESTDWLTRGIPKEQIEQEKQISHIAMRLWGTGFSTAEKCEKAATDLVNNGYRKQSEGKLIIESHGDGHCFGFCGNCGARYEASNASALVLQYRYCNYCGAKMKGV